MFVKKKTRKTKQKKKQQHVFVWQILSDNFIRSFDKFKLQPTCTSRFPIYLKIIIINVCTCILQVRESYCKIIFKNVYINVCNKERSNFHVLSLITHIHQSRLLLIIWVLCAFKRNNFLYTGVLFVHNIHYW